MNCLPPLTGIERLLIVKTSSLGDVLHALPAAQLLKEANPALTLGWVVRRRCADLLEGCPFIDELYVIESKPSVRELMRLRQTLNRARYQVALDMQGLFLSGVVTRLSGAPIRVGWDRNREANGRFLTHPIVPGRPAQVGVRHEVDLLFGFPAALGVGTRPGTFPPQPYLAADGRDKAQEWLRELPRPRIAFNVGAARAYKRWPTEHWARLTGDLAEQGVGLVFVGDEKDAETVARIRAGLPRAAQIVDVSGHTTLRELAAVLAGCDLMISGDTGPMHIAAALGTPVVALFGATDPRRHGPYGRRHTVLHDAALVANSRPTDQQGAAAMRAIAPVSVAAAAQTILVGQP